MQAMITTLRPIGNSTKNSVSGQKKEIFASAFSLPEAWKQNSTARKLLTGSVQRIDLEELEKILQDPTAKYCVYKEEIQGIKKYL